MQDPNGAWAAFQADHTNLDCQRQADSTVDGGRNRGIKAGFVTQRVRRVAAAARVRVPGHLGAPARSR